MNTQFKALAIISLAMIVSSTSGFALDRSHDAKPAEPSKNLVVPDFGPVDSRFSLAPSRRPAIVWAPRIFVARRSDLFPGVMSAFVLVRPTAAS